MVSRNARRVAVLLLAAALLAAPSASATSHSASPADTSELTEMSSPSDGWDGLPWPALDGGVPRVVFDIADRISVLVYGEIIATDAPGNIRQNKRVQEAYLGEDAGEDIGEDIGEDT